MPDKIPELRFGPYVAPPVKEGDRIWCSYMRRFELVGPLSDAPIPWPTARRPGRPRLIVFDRLLLAAGTEKTKAVASQWGVSRITVGAWRKRLGLIERSTSPTPPRPYWTPDEDAMLGTATDREIAETIGRPKIAVRLRRMRLGIPSYRSNPGAPEIDD